MATATAIWAVAVITTVGAEATITIGGNQPADPAPLAGIPGWPQFAHRAEAISFGSRVDFPDTPTSSGAAAMRTPNLRNGYYSKAAGNWPFRKMTVGSSS